MDKFPNGRGPYHDRNGGGRSGPRRRTSLLCSCLIATIFLVVVVAALAAVFFTLFRPRDPTIAVSAVRLPSYAARNGTVSFTFEQRASVRNPNRAALSHYDSSLQLACGGREVGFMFIPAGEIGGGRTQYMAATFEVGSFPAAEGAEKVEVVSRMRVKGKVRMLRFLTHHVEATAGCRVGVSTRDGSVLGLQC